MSAEHKELYSLLIPLKQERLLVPRMCVAEVITFAETQSVIGDDVPDWYLGTVEWNGRQLPVVSFDGSRADDAASKKRGRTRIVVFHAITRQLKGGYYGILTQGFPQLVRVNEDVLTLDPEWSGDDGQPVLCRVRMIHEYPLIPDVERLEEMVADVLQSAQVAPEGLQ
ncbi:MAG: chemotaxis protein CheW [Gammaproteobacteria bacterium]|nr:chemotaxis protein CheW [Gammaproteobacteria bacterium]